MPALHVALLALLAALGLPAGPLGAQTASEAEEDDPLPLITDRPDFTESAVAVRRAQLEAGYTVTVGGGADVHRVGEVLLRVPAARGLELRVGLPSFVGDDDPLAEDGFDDALLGAKLELAGGAESSSGADVALLAEARLPVGERSAEGVEPGGRLSVGLPVSARLDLGVNLGAASVEDGAGRFGELVGTVAAGLDLGSGLGLYGELFGFARTDGRSGASFADGGLTYALGPDLQLDARVEVPLHGAPEDLSFGVGISARR